VTAVQILVTGARGFIGRHLCAHLAAAGYRVVGLGHGAWLPQEYAASGLAAWHNGDVSHANLDVLAHEHGLPGGVVHLAGGSAVGPSFAQPAEDFRRSVGSASALAEWLRLHAPGAPVVLASSAAVYGATHAHRIAETAACAPFSPYGFHKRMAELALESYARNFGLRVALVRLFSVYGSGLRKQLLWDACTQLVQGEAPLALGGTGHELRDWLHVGDAARLLTLALELASSDAPVFNGGTGVATSVREVAECLCERWGGGVGVVFSGRSRPGDPPQLVADARRVLASGFQPHLDWRSGLADYVQWFRDDRAVAGAAP